jgi:flagellar biosynthesis anti-sigma factor FlgM
MKVSGKIGNPMQSTEAAKTNQTTNQTSVDTLGEGKRAAKSAFGSAAAGTSARVDLSQRAQDIKKAKELATPAETIDEAKVARLQKMIDQGKYKIDAESIADRLVDEHLLTQS